MTEHKPFTSLSRRQRRSKTQQAKNLIYRERYRCGGVFFDECDLEYASTSGSWNWSDVIFLGTKPDTFWNAEIVTASLAFDDAVETLAYERAPAPTGPLITDDGELTAAWRVPQPEYDGLTWSQHVDKLKKEIARDNAPAVYCCYRILPGYRSGIGLRIVVDADVLSREIIETAIADFLAKGEVNWVSPEPVTNVGLTNILHCNQIAHTSNLVEALRGSESE